MSLYQGAINFPVNITLPDDGQPRTVSTINPAWEALADRTQYLRMNVPRADYTDVNLLGASTFNTLNAVVNVARINYAAGIGGLPAIWANSFPMQLQARANAYVFCASATGQLQARFNFVSDTPTPSAFTAQSPWRQFEIGINSYIQIVSDWTLYVPSGFNSGKLELQLKKVISNASDYQVQHLAMQTIILPLDLP